MLNVREQIASEIKKVVKELTGLDMEVSLDRPKDEAHGDYSTNIAMALFSNQESRIKNQEWKNPLELAKKISDQFMIHNSQFMIPARAEVVKPGFINFWLSEKYLLENVESVLEEKEKFGFSEKDKNKKIIVEFTDPNPFKEFHIGHLYSNVVGESICRLLEAQKGVVKRANYQGDVGMHIAKSLWGLLHLCHAEFISASEIVKNKILKQVQDDKLSRRIEFLGEAYALGSKAYEEDESVKKEIGELNKKIYDKDSTVMVLYEKGRQWSLEYFETMYKRLGTKFDYYYFESEVGFEGLELVKKYLKKGVFEKSQNAVIFRGKKYGLHDRVFINSLGLPTYEAKELGLAPIKYKDFKYDQSIIITGNEIKEYFKVLLAALKQIHPDLAAKTKHIGHGMVRLPTGKMSSRTGNVVTGEWLLDEAKNRVKSSFKEMDEKILEKVAVGAVKYALLKGGIGRDIAFSFDESISLEGNSGPYLQYTFARTQSVLSKSHVILSETKDLAIARDSSVASLPQNDITTEEVSLLRTIQRFSEIVEEAGESFAPNLLCNYLFDLAQKFNLFYQKHKILSPVIVNEMKNPNQTNEILRSAQDDNIQEFRLALTQAVGQIIKNGLHLLGISTPERM